MDGFNTFEKQDKVLLGLNSGSDAAAAMRILRQQGFAVQGLFILFSNAHEAALEKARDDLEKLEVLNARIPAAALSAQISRMEKAGAAILQQVREHPEKGRDIRKFVTYYLPTAVKILTTYADLSASGAGGENAKSLMSDVEKNAGTIAAAFEAQLDALFAGEVLDVSSDIAVLDGMLSGDGLSGKNNLKLS